MELRVLRYFLEIAREGSITRAAERLHVSQPTLSKQLKDLEAELGKKLFVRSNYSVKLTDEGMLLRKRAEDILEMADKTADEFKALGEIAGGDIRIGCAESDGVKYLARCVKSLQEQYPRIRLHLYSGNTEDVSERLDKGLLDFGVLLGDIDETKYNHIQLPMRDVWGVLMPRSSPLAELESVRPRDLWDKPLILSRQVDNKSGLYRWLGREPDQLNTVATYNLIYNASLMVDEGMGYAFTLDKLVNTTGSRLCFRPLEPRLELGMYLVWKKYRVFSRAAELFLETLEESLSCCETGESI